MFVIQPTDQDFDADDQGGQIEPEIVTQIEAEVSCNACDDLAIHAILEMSDGALVFVCRECEHVTVAT